MLWLLLALGIWLLLGVVDDFVRYGRLQTRNGQAIGTGPTVLVLLIVALLILVPVWVMM